MYYMEKQHNTQFFACPQCTKTFATRSNLKRHMENPNIHDIPYPRSRDQKRWKDHAKKVVSKEETTERMRKWRSENREKNRQNDLRCRVYRLARQRYGEHDSPGKQQFIRDEITRRLGRRAMLQQKENHDQKQNNQQHTHHTHRNNMSQRVPDDADMSGKAPFRDLPFYSVPQQKIELPYIASQPSTAPCSPTSLHTSSHWSEERRSSSSSISSDSSISSLVTSVSSTRASERATDMLKLPSTHSRQYSSEIKYVEQSKILDEFVGIVLDYAGFQSLVIYP